MGAAAAAAGWQPSCHLSLARTHWAVDPSRGCTRHLWPRDIVRERFPCLTRSHIPTVTTYNVKIRRYAPQTNTQKLRRACRPPQTHTTRGVATVVGRKSEQPHARKQSFNRSHGSVHARCEAGAKRINVVAAKTCECGPNCDPQRDPKLRPSPEAAGRCDGAVAAKRWQVAATLTAISIQNLYGGGASSKLITNP